MDSSTDDEAMGAALAKLRDDYGCGTVSISHAPLFALGAQPTGVATHAPTEAAALPSTSTGSQPWMDSLRARLAVGLASASQPATAASAPPAVAPTAAPLAAPALAAATAAFPAPPAASTSLSAQAVSSARPPSSPPQPKLAPGAMDEERLELLMDFDASVRQRLSALRSVMGATSSGLTRSDAASPARTDAMNFAALFTPSAATHAMTRHATASQIGASSSSVQPRAIVDVAVCASSWSALVNRGRRVRRPPSNDAASAPLLLRGTSGVNRSSGMSGSHIAHAASTSARRVVARTESPTRRASQGTGEHASARSTSSEQAGRHDEAHALNASTTSTGTRTSTVEAANRSGARFSSPAKAAPVLEPGDSTEAISTQRRPQAHRVVTSDPIADAPATSGVSSTLVELGGDAFVAPMDALAATVAPASAAHDVQSAAADGNASARPATAAAAREGKPQRAATAGTSTPRFMAHTAAWGSRLQQEPRHVRISPPKGAGGPLALRMRSPVPKQFAVAAPPTTTSMLAVHASRRSSPHA